MFKKLSRPLSVITALLLLCSIVGMSFTNTVAATGQLANRNLTLQAGPAHGFPAVSDGGSLPGGLVNHIFTFKTYTTASIGSIQFLYCTLADPVPGNYCTTPTGLSTTGATMGTQNGATFTSIAGSNGQPYLSRVAANINANTQLTFQLIGITNPTPTVATLAYPLTFYVRISTFTSTDASGTPIDSGNVAASTANAINLSGQMPESLVFCTGATISTTGGVPDCTTATAGSVNFNQLFSPTDTATATSQMVASTNAGAGYAITVNGSTLMSGTNQINGIVTAAMGIRGTSQFGLNLKANTIATSTPPVGVEVAPAANGANYRGEASAGFSAVDYFQFNTGDTVADSYNGGGTVLGTDAQLYTVSYIANVVGSQPAGTYTTTLTYICTPTF